MGKPIIDKNDIVGKQFGRWYVIRYDHTRNYEHYYLCRCVCGTERLVTRRSLYPKTVSKSCGCLKIEKASLVNLKHHLYKHPLRSVWSNMKQRCYNPTNKKYSIYGNRGIIVCPEWLNNFEAFYNWSINNGYKKGLSIDRIDSNGNYEPSNCRWTTINVQNQNTSKNHYLTYNGETHCISEWSKILKINRNTLQSKILKGLTLEEILH